MESNQTLFNSDGVVYSLYTTLLEDFRSLLDEPHFGRKAEVSLLSGMTLFRDHLWPTLGSVEPIRYKASWQMECLLKKYRFQTDKYTDLELEERTNAAFLKTQIGLLASRPTSERSHRVLRRARCIAKEILGEYNVEEVALQSRFGKRASIGCSYRKAYIDFKLTHPKCITSSKSCMQWFYKSYVPFDSLLERLVRKATKHKLFEARQTCIHYLKAAKVPKSWKILRLITPLTLISLFYSYGVGSCVADRLRARKLDIRRLQAIHRQLAQEFSISRSHATADLSHASDSITSWLLNAVLPRPWFNAIRKTFVRSIEIDGVTYGTGSVLPMGNGCTFPVETLVFYCLIKAVGELSNKRGGVYSVYGDDLIYPSSIHAFVAPVLNELGFSINAEKTFVTSNFRESCGGDYYHGVDVRPAIITGGGSKLSKNEYLAFLYTMHNSLTRRWDECEISRSLELIRGEILRVASVIYQVPPSYPDYSGIKTQDPYACLFKAGNWMLPRVSRIVDRHGQYVDGMLKYEFLCLRSSPRKRVVISEEPYLWQALKQDSDTPFVWSEDITPAIRRRCRVASTLVRNQKGRRKIALEWLKAEPPGSTRPFLTTKIVKRGGKRESVTLCSSKTELQLLCVTGTEAFWT